MGVFLILFNFALVVDPFRLYYRGIILHFFGIFLMLALKKNRLMGNMHTKHKTMLFLSYIFVINHIIYFLAKCVSCNLNGVDLVLFNSILRLYFFLFIPSQLFENITNSLHISSFAFLNLFFGGFLLTFSSPYFTVISTADFGPGFLGENPDQSAYTHRPVSL